MRDRAIAVAWTRRAAPSARTRCSRWPRPGHCGETRHHRGCVWNRDVVCGFAYGCCVRPAENCHGYRKGKVEILSTLIKNKKSCGQIRVEITLFTLTLQAQSQPVLCGFLFICVRLYRQPGTAARRGRGPTFAARESHTHTRQHVDTFRFHSGALLYTFTYMF